MSLIKAFVLIFLLLILACSSGNSVAGGDDFPNSNISAALAKQISSDMKISEEWNTWDSILDTVPEKSSFTPFMDGLILTGKDPLSKFDTLTGKCVYLWDDTINGILRICSEKQYPLLGITILDTLTILYNDLARDTIQSNEQVVKINGIRISSLTSTIAGYVTTDNDTDGVFDTCWYYVLKYENVFSTINQICFTAGVDLDISSLSDNEIVLWRHLILNQNDTVSITELTDVDNDGVHFRLSQSDSAVVKYSREIRLISAGIRLYRKNSRIVYFIDSPEKSYPIRYSDEIRFTNGSVRERLIKKALSADSTCLPGDTTIAFERWSHQNNDRDTIIYNVVLSKVPLRYEENRLLMFTIAHSRAAAEIVETRLQCTPDLSVSGKLQTGNFTLSGKLKSGITFTVTGYVDLKEIKGTYTDDNGQTVPVSWPRE